MAAAKVDAHRAWLDAGHPERAARCAFWQALGLFFRGDLAPATGWVAEVAATTGRSGGVGWLRS
jgi:hypothetical protein